MNCPNHPDVLADTNCSTCGRLYCRDCVVDLGGKPYCATCKDEQIRDIKSGTTGAFGDLASPWARFGAQFLDGLLLGVFFFVLMFFGGILAAQRMRPNSDRPPHVPFGPIIAAYIVFFIVSIVYEWRMLAANGQTLGKRAVGIKVVREDGMPLGSAAWKRPLARWIFAVIPFLGIIDSLAIFSEEHLTLHDRAAKTVVINWKR